MKIDEEVYCLICGFGKVIKTFDNNSFDVFFRHSGKILYSEERKSVYCLKNEKKSLFKIKEIDYNIIIYLLKNRNEYKKIDRYFIIDEILNDFSNIVNRKKLNEEFPEYFL